MTQYIIYFNQQWVGEHPEEWFAARGPLARSVVDEIRSAGEYVFAGGVDEDMSRAFRVSVTDDGSEIESGQHAPGEQYIGGFTIVDVEDDEKAKFWARAIAEACGWPQEVRQVV
ncbi:hypothetical protein [uncultured Microbacterium sp.]|uniref:YciI family protein n=1 Tax=uncultured Microbacterium sp. TaxID=191216 RepID=UPI002603C909|nr:hypothetical protein [uncultured Microbacterium sp.]